MMNPEVLQVVHEKDPWIEESKWDTIEEEVTEIVDKKSRRKSWHAIKFERKRRKGVVEPGSPPEARQKRPSWWNIFGGQQWPRSRRASQDGGRVAKENVPWMRSKSRSVDHGISSPFDLDALRAKVDSQLDKNLDRDLDGSSNSLAEKKKTGPPENTTTYTVADRDTLTSVAARFDTTPSELTKLNRLATPYIFPGQQLYVPIRETAGNESEGSTPVEDSHDDLPPEEKELLDNLRPVSPKPGHVERVRTPSCNQSSTDLEEESAVFRERFLKINVRHITDGQGVVSGVLLVTPNAVMFDPNVSDPLVIEHGPEAYGVIAPMEFVVNAAIYNDIAHMRVGHSVETSTTAEKPEIYYPKAESRNEQDSMMVKDETFPELVAGDDAESVCSCTEREGDAFPKAFERELVTPTNLEENEQRSAEERRKSLLDHHWAIPSRDRQSIDTDEIPAISSSMIQEDQIDEEENLVKESCHDSGIDIRESSIPPVAPHPKKQYSDADIVLSKEWVPPITIAPTNVSDTESLARKKTNSVSFSLDSSSEAESGVPLSTSCSESKEETEKADTRKNKMLKRLSYPLSWMETLAGDKEEEKPPNHPHSADVHHSSVFSKVFSSSPINLVDFGTGLFLNKTPSEESGGSGGPHSAGSGGPPLSDSPRTDSSSFFPTNIISSVGASVGAVGASVGAMGASVGATVGAMGAQVGASVGAVGATVGAVGRSSVGTFIRQPTESSTKSKAPPPKLDYRSMVSVDDMPELFVSFDKLIPRPARSCEDPPLYLRLRMGKPLDKPIPRSTPLMSYGKKKMRPEYWFSVPRNRVDELYKFIQAWVPHLYGELNEEQVKARNFALVEMDTELWSEEPTPSASRHGSQDGELTEITKESWELIKAPYVKIYSIIKTQTMSADGSDEVIPMSEEYRRAFYSSAAPSIDAELTPPDLIGTTEILTDYHREALCRHLPARAEGYSWTLVFSTSQHGFSLNSMYRKMFKLESPILLVIEDTDNNVFGALTSCALQVSEHFYGTGESLLFRFSPEFQVYNWTGENLYFIKGNNESLSIGAGDGKFGLWLDGDLYLGRSEPCKTYGNDPLTPKVDFVVKTLECWAFVSS
ncbi:oxidation resistance protein 1 isoform X2 [Tribolium castaneum]|uniref:oxidation resistance protein 1 isoform X2 n=1 Tax=Tribolium castaneum TaxID=7070 RepID=UPI00077D990B|nr:PREDICTED: oxidation resistance protein 1 isoform X2 [Tribolium castaneum]|eukprot:XP_015835717.1 PREDICTED: oxidation resistance protein 1 isoform X2 [Tribolium castaneum]